MNTIFRSPRAGGAVTLCGLMPASSRLGFWIELLRPRRPFTKRYEAINYFVRARRARRYLEIGVATGRTFERVRCAEKIGVDPRPKRVEPGWTVHRTTSDEFFAGAPGRFDVVFIDGLHLAEQVLRDIANSLAYLNPGGAILLHDCNPPTEVAGSRDASLADKGALWNGDVWKAIAYVRKFQPGLFCRVLDFNEGIGVIIPRDYGAVPRLGPPVLAQAQEFLDRLSWKDLESDRRGLLGLIPNRAELEDELRREGMAIRV